MVTKVAMVLSRRVRIKSKMLAIQFQVSAGNDRRRIPKLHEMRLQRFTPALYFAADIRSFLMTSPPFITNLTRCISEMSCSGSPETAMMSA